jgi:Putative metallopeptidase
MKANMGRIRTTLSLVFAAACIELFSNSQLHAQASPDTQTPAAAWSTFLNGNDADLQPDRIRIDYEEPKSAELQPLYHMLIRRHALPKVKEIFSPLRLPVDVTVRNVECGVSNAWYQRPVVTICYEYARDILKMAPQETSPDGITPEDAVVGQFLYTAAHEMGHAVFDLLDIPLFGRPEDAADEFAAHVLLRIGKEDARKLVEGAAYTYTNYVRNPTVTVPVTAFADVHGAPMQRLYNLICIAYGADHDMFADLVGSGFLSKERAPDCRVEFGELNFAFQRLIYPYLDPKLLSEVLSKSWVPVPNARPPRLSDMTRVAP